MKINELDIPEQIKRIIIQHGYNQLYPPQEEAITAGVLNGKNVVLASPTASGKTLVAELCILKNILENDTKSIYLTPLRALANEKYEEFKKYRELTKSNGDKLEITVSTGDYDSIDEWLGKYDIIISTNEKADSLLRHKAVWMQQIDTIVADEIHLLTDQGRGPTLEVILTKLMKLNPDAQFLLLSATVKNADEISKWIKGIPITTEWRPVPLREGVFYDGEIQFKDGSARRILTETKKPAIDIALDIIKQGGQALIFTQTRRDAVSYGKNVSKVLSRKISADLKKDLKTIANKILTSGEKTGLSEILAEQVKSSTAFHHAGLNVSHRRLIEKSFKNGKIKILSTTPTLAAGVNLPARAVLISNYRRYDPESWSEEISVLEYKQLAGRAGRPKYDKVGESILIAKTSAEQERLMEKYVCSEPEKIWSKLSIENVLRPHVLSTIATGFAYTEEDLYDFFSQTFHAQQHDLKMLKSKVGKILRFLFNEEMITMESRKLLATPFGRRVSELYIDPVSAVIIRDGLYNRPDKLTEVSILQLISHTPDLSPKLYPRGKESEQLIAYASEHSSELIFKQPDPWNSMYSYEQNLDDFISEIKCVAVMEDWIQEITENDLLGKYKVEPGDLLRLTQTAEWLIFASNQLARLFQHKDLMRKFPILRHRIQYGIKEELIELVGLQGIGRIRARMLHNAGFHKIADIRKANLQSLVSVPTIGTTLAENIKKQIEDKNPAN
ncbi:DEAD/DEAH box helicase [Candidatus Bathyarchaeota archaeon]|nr:DEAD/DEAH box helicase [Candidatus Bathyarchaeota archaeon]